MSEYRDSFLTQKVLVMAAELHQDKQAIASVDTDKKTQAEKSLRAVVSEVQRDSRKDSQRYLDETTVPHGGE